MFLFQQENLMKILYSAGNDSFTLARFARTINVWTLISHRKYGKWVKWAKYCSQQMFPRFYERLIPTRLWKKVKFFIIHCLPFMLPAVKRPFKWKFSRFSIISMLSICFCVELIVNTAIILLHTGSLCRTNELVIKTNLQKNFSQFSPGFCRTCNLMHF